MKKLGASRFADRQSGAKAFMAGAIAVNMLVLSGCGAAETSEEAQTQETAETETVVEAQPVAEEEPADVYGNYYGNLYQSGMAVYTQDYGTVFYDAYIGATCYLDGDQLQIVYPGGLKYLNYYNDKLYGISQQDPFEGCLVQVNMDGSSPTIFREDSVDYLSMVNGILYFTSQEDSLLYSYDVSNYTETKLFNEAVYYPVIVEGKCYFQRDAEGESLWSLDLETMELTQLSKERAFLMWPAENYLYFLRYDADDNEFLYRVNYDGTQEQCILDNEALSAVIYNSLVNASIIDDTLYYLNVNENTSLYFASLDLKNEGAEAVKYDVTGAFYQAFSEYFGMDELTIIGAGQITYLQDHLFYITVEVVNGDSSEWIPFIYDLTTDTATLVESMGERNLKDIVRKEFELMGIVCSDEDWDSVIVTDNSKERFAESKTAEECKEETENAVINEASAAGSTSVEVGYDEEMAKTAFNQINGFRTDAGLSPLTWNDSLAASCNTRASELVTSFSHTRPDGSSAVTAAEELGIVYTSFGENIAYGQTSAAQVAMAWYNSEDHRHNILDTDYSQGAISCFYYNGTYYWVQHFMN